MKLHNFLIILLFLANGDCLCQNQFHYKRVISGVAQEGWYSLSLTPDIFKQLNNDLSDIRLYSLKDMDTLELPYLLKVHAEEISQSTFQLPVVNKSLQDGVLYLMFELQSSQKVNYIDLEFDQLNFFAFATIEGSADKKHWFEITRDQRIVSIKKESGDYALSTINFPVTDYRFLRISVRSDTPLTFRRASFQHHQVKPGRFDNIPLTWTATTDNKTRQSLIEIELNDYLPVSSLDIEIDNTSDYYRSFRLEYVRDSAKTEKGWIKYYQTIHDGFLTSFKPNHFDFDWKLAKALRLTIRNLDNAPLLIKNISAEGPVVELVSFLKPGENFMLYGHDRLYKAAYDLAYFENKIPDSLTSATFGPAESIGVPEEEGKPLFESKAWLWSIVGLMIGGLGFFTIKMMQHKH